MAGKLRTFFAAKRHLGKWISDQSAKVGLSAGRDGNSLSSRKTPKSEVFY
jgi:hypothetical protein